MAKIYSIQEIEKINRTFTGVLNFIYEAADGNKYVGTSKGNLLLAQKANAVMLDKATSNDTGFDNASDAIAYAVGRNYETIVDFETGNDGEETIVFFDLFDTKVKNNSRIYGTVIWNSTLTERDPKDAALEQLKVYASTIIENQKVTMAVIAPNGASGRYAIKTQVS